MSDSFALPKGPYELHKQAALVAQLNTNGPSYVFRGAFFFIVEQPAALENVYPVVKIRTLVSRLVGCERVV